MRRMRTSTWMALLLSVVLSGCTPPMAHVARGDVFITGKPIYDDFFAKVRVVRAEGLDCAGAERASHAGLRKALGLAENSPPDLVPQTGVRPGEEASGARGAPSSRDYARATTDCFPDSRRLGTEGEAFVKTLDEAARSALDVRKQLATVAARANDLAKRRLRLRTEAPIAFHDVPLVQSNEAMFELDSAEGVLADASDAANRYASAASWFVVELAQAVETGAAGELGTIRVAVTPHVTAAAPALNRVVAPPPAVPPDATPPPTPSPASPPRRGKAVDEL